MADPSAPSIPPPNAKAGVLLAGTTVAGRYRVEARLGAGGMGSVYRVQHIHMRKRFALKLLHEDAAQSEEMVARFEREAMATAHIEHPNITAATDFGRTEDGSFFLVLEYLEGQRLRDALEEGLLAVPRALHIARQMASALERSHEHGVIHRDLKPENIMLVHRQGDRDFVKVLDFGFAKVTGGMSEPGSGRPANALSRQGIAYGTPWYMAPEQCIGGSVDARSDLYALGLVLFEMLTGVPPFSGDDPSKVMRHQLSTPIPRMADVAPGAPIPASLEAVVKRLTEKHPEKRYASATQLLAALAEVAAQEGIALPEPSAQPAGSPSRPLGQDAGEAVQTLASAELFAADNPPAASQSLAVNESQILSEQASPKAPAAAAPRAAAPPGAGSRLPGNHDQKTQVLPIKPHTASGSSLTQRLRARLPDSLQRVPLPWLLLAPISLLGLLLALLARM